MATKLKAAEGRRLRICDVCGQVDDHPRHEHYEGEGIPVRQDHLAAVIERTDLTNEDKTRIVAEIVDTASQQRHIDCCAEVGCPCVGLDTECKKVLDAGGEGLKGMDLVEFIASGAVDHLNAAVQAEDQEG